MDYIDEVSRIQAEQTSTSLAQLIRLRRTLQIECDYRLRHLTGVQADHGHSTYIWIISRKVGQLLWAQEHKPEENSRVRCTILFDIVGSDECLKVELELFALSRSAGVYDVLLLCTGFTGQFHKVQRGSGEGRI